MSSYPAKSDAIVIGGMAAPDKDDRPFVQHQAKSNMFFKTKLCAKFMTGTCYNGSNCSFAHGHEDMRFPPPNWRQLIAHGEDRGIRSSENDQKKILQPCKIFQSGKECPYGDKCIFQHQNLIKFRADNDPSRKYQSVELDRIKASTGINFQVETWSDACGDEDLKQFVASFTGHGGRGKGKYSYWKTKICMKYETTGNCQFGKTCNFAHGQAELQVSGGHTQSRLVSVVIQPPRPPAIPAAPQPQSIHSSSASGSNAENASHRVGPRINWIAQEKGLGKISRVYGDRIDTFPPN